MQSRPRQRVEPVEHVLRAEPAAASAYLSGYWLPPVGASALSQSAVSQLVDERQQILDRQARVAGDRRRRARTHLAELGHVDVDVDLGRVHAELRQLAGDAVVPAGADRHDEVAVHHRLVRVGGAVHAEHAEVERVGPPRQAPLPSSVFTIGAFSFSASCMTALPAPEITAPWPT